MKKIIPFVIILLIVFIGIGIFLFFNHSNNVNEASQSLGKAQLVEIYDNIIFIIPPTTYNEVFNAIGSPNEYEKIQEYKNNIFWSFDLKNYRKSNWWSKTANTDISDKITIRTANTMRKILEICNK